MQIYSKNSRLHIRVVNGSKLDGRAENGDASGKEEIVYISNVFQRKSNSNTVVRTFCLHRHYFVILPTEVNN